MIKMLCNLTICFLTFVNEGIYNACWKAIKTIQPLKCWHNPQYSDKENNMYNNYDNGVHV